MTLRTPPKQMAPFLGGRATSPATCPPAAGPSHPLFPGPTSSFLSSSHIRGPQRNKCTTGRRCGNLRQPGPDKEPEAQDGDRAGAHDQAPCLSTARAMTLRKVRERRERWGFKFSAGRAGPSPPPAVNHRRGMQRTPAAQSSSPLRRRL